MLHRPHPSSALTRRSLIRSPLCADEAARLPDELDDCIVRRVGGGWGDQAERVRERAADVHRGADCSALWRSVAERPRRRRCCARLSRPERSRSRQGSAGDVEVDNGRTADRRARPPDLATAGCVDRSQAAAAALIAWTARDAIPRGAMGLAVGFGLLHPMLSQYTPPTVSYVNSTLRTQSV